MENYNPNTVMAIFFVAIAVVLIGGLAITVSQQTALAAEPTNPKKVTICHIPPGNPDERHTITVAASAVDKHEEHGDTIGACRRR